MKVLKLLTFKQKLCTIIAISAIARTIVFFLLPNSASHLVPDEGAYAATAKWAASGQLSSQIQYYQDLWKIGRTLLYPASMLVQFGLGELSAIRIVSSMYGLLSVAVITILINSHYRKLNQDSRHQKFNETLILSALILFAILPSHFLWSILGLRDSASEFWILTSMATVFLFHQANNWQRIFLTTFLLISVVLTFNSRPQAGWVLAASLLIFFLFNLKEKITYLIILVISVGTYAGYLTTEPNIIVTKVIYVAKEDIKSPSKEVTNRQLTIEESEASKLCNASTSSVTFHSKEFTCSKTYTVVGREQSTNLVSSALDQIGSIPVRQNLNQVAAASRIEPPNCPWDENSKKGKFACLAFRAPNAVFIFLFRPLLFLDITSTASVFAAVENLLWISFFGLILFGIIKFRRVQFKKQIAPSMVFSTLYVLGAASFEGNMGTAFRHKSLILWAVLLLLLSIFWRGSQVSLTNPESKPTKNAV